MIITCDCSFEDGDPAKVENVTWRKARRVHVCCECREDIPRGVLYEHVSGLWDQHWSTFKTCKTCTRIRDHYCPNGGEYGGLAEQIWDCIGFDYRKVPTDEDE